MTYLEGDLVWIAHSALGYSKSKVVRLEGPQQVVVQLLDSKEEVKVNITATYPYSPEDDKNYEDMIQIQNLTEATLLYNLKQRYSQNDIYTYIGNVLVSINPFQSLNIYSNDMIQKYKDIGSLGELKPHIYAVSSRAYHSMISERKNQSVIISGESGSGKTEATKSCIQFLVQVSSGGSASAESSSAGANGHNSSSVERDILDSNPILEAFGNSRTTKNYNSSRFGKFLKIEFRQSDWRIVGASIETYLLEKSRISHRPDRLNMNYHIFYYLVWGIKGEEQKQWSIPNDPTQFRYLDASDEVLESYKKTSMNPKQLGEAYKAIRGSMDAIGFSKDETQSIFKVLAAILHLGNIEFIKDPSTGFSEVCSKKAGVEASLSTAAALLGVPSGLFKQSLLNRNLKASGRGSIYTKPMEVDQSEQARDALAKSLYFKLFHLIVEKINQKINGPKTGASDNLFIGVLDIFGFECLSMNSLDQLLINVTNERIQQQFNQTVFESEQKEYLAENIPWKSTQFTDNKDCIDLIEKKQYGLLSLLDDECLMPKGSEQTLLEKYNAKYLNSNQHYQRSLAKGTFGIKHFAGEVVYTLDGWLEKNRDSLLLDLEDLLITSMNDLVRTMFAQGAQAPASTPPSPAIAAGPSRGNSKPPSLTRERLSSASSGSSGSLPTMKKPNQSVSSQFIDQLNRLISTINSTSVHYIRCIKPNVTLDPNNFNNIHILSQLRNVGLLQTVQIRKMGYSYRKEYKLFLNRYSVLKKVGGAKKSGADGKQLCGEILEALSLEFSKQQGKRLSPQALGKDPYQIGKSKVFLTDELYIFLEMKRADRIIDSVRKIQSFFKMLKLRRAFQQKMRSAMVLQTSIRAHLKRKEVGRLLADEKRKREEERQKEAERKRKEEEERQKEAERKRKEEEKRAKEEEDKRLREEEKRLKEEEKQKQKELEKKRKEEEKLKKEEEERLKKLEREKEKEKEKESTSTSLFSNIKSTLSKVTGNEGSSNSNTGSANGSASAKSIFISSDVYSSEKREAQFSKPLPSVIAKSSRPIPIAKNSKWNITSSPSGRSPRYLNNNTAKSPTEKVMIGHRKPVSHSAPTKSLLKEASENGFSIRKSDDNPRTTTTTTTVTSPNGSRPTSPIKFSPVASSPVGESIGIGSSSPGMSPLTLSISQDSIEKSKRLRNEILKEIIVTEKDYIRDLAIVLEVFLPPIKEKSLLSPKESGILFNNIEILYSLNKTMYEELIGGIDEENPTYENVKVGQAFLKMSHYLKMYNSYCSNQQQALKLLEEEKSKNQPFRDFLELCMADGRCRGLPLLSFIIKPVQRICKYPLLLKEVIKYTPETHPERQPLEEADRKISEIVASINEGKRMVEMFQKILELQSSIDGINDNLMEPGRQLLMEGQVTSVKELSSEESLQRTLFLFNNLIILCSPISVMASAINNFKSKKSQYKLKASIPIPLARIMYVADTDAVKYAIELWNTKEETNFILCFNSESQRMQWFKQIKNLIQDYKLSNSGRQLSRK